MNVTYACCQCQQTSRQDLDDTTTVLRCDHCGYEQRVPPGAIEEGRLKRCVVCPSDELFVRKDFSQRLGLTIIMLGFVASSVAWYYYRQYLAFGILVGTALLDVVLYLLVGNLLQCYRCRSEYRDLESLDEYESFDLETHEKHRQQEARLAQARRSAPPDRPVADRAPSAAEDPGLESSGVPEAEDAGSDSATRPGEKSAD
jgi:hypothetical protein